MFFIVASARSGTTLLRMMLNAHPNVAVPPESRFITELYKGGRVERNDFLKELAAHKRFAAWELSIENVAAELEGSDDLSFRDAIEAAYRAYARERGKERFGDKTPRYVVSIPFLARLWPEGRFVHIVRDGRAVALSYADVPFGPRTVAKAARLWAQRVHRGIADGRPLGPARYLELRYEDLVENPEARLKELCAFLDLDFDDAMLHHAESAGDEVLERARTFNPNVTGPVAPTRSWEEQMPRPQVEVFEAVAGDVLEELDYRRLFPTPSARARAAALLGRAGLPIDRLEASRSR